MNAVERCRRSYERKRERRERMEWVIGTRGLRQRQAFSLKRTQENVVVVRERERDAVRVSRPRCPFCRPRSKGLPYCHLRACQTSRAPELGPGPGLESGGFDGFRPMGRRPLQLTWQAASRLPAATPKPAGKAGVGGSWASSSAGNPLGAKGKSGDAVRPAPLQLRQAPDGPLIKGSSWRFPST